MLSKKKIGILGSTGSIGKSACELIRTSLRDKFTIEYLLCEKNFEEISKQIIEFKPKAVCVSPKIFSQVSALFHDVEIFECPDTMLKKYKTDVTLHAISGVAGIKCILPAISGTKILALANKESIVSAWNFIQEASIEYGTQIIPVDSEHNSLYRVLEIINPDSIVKLGITASGGPFFGKKFSSLSDISPQYAANHPVWKMGIKNSIDSATMANKVLELIEVMQLFSCKEEDIDVMINRQSIVHANVWLKSGGMLSFSSKPDMKFHIAHAIMFPEHEEASENILQNTMLEFHEIKRDEFPLFFIGREVAKTQNPIKFTIFNVANEVAVQKFFSNQIKYTDILAVVENSLAQLNYTSPSSIEDLVKMIEEIKIKVNEY